jgi:hypothetical protein
MLAHEHDRIERSGAPGLTARQQNLGRAAHVITAGGCDGAAGKVGRAHLGSYPTGQYNYP